MWEAAEHASKVSQLDAELAELRYAGDSPPERALRSSLTKRREQHQAVLLGVQREADALARHAGSAVAAARLALAQTGNLAALEAVVPSRRAIVAAGALAEARARLAMLTELWTELDTSTGIAQAALPELEER